MDYVKAITTWIKLSPKYLIVLTAVSGFLLFAPAKYIDSLGLSYVTNSHKWIVALAFLLSLALLIIATTVSVGLFIRGKIKHFLKYHNLPKRLNDLTEEEKIILRVYIEKNTKTQNLDAESGVVAGLEQNKIIYRATTIGENTNSWPFNIQNWARKHLQKHPKLLD